MHFRHLKFHAALFCAILGIEPVLLRKWLAGNSLDAELRLDGNRERPSANAPRFYSYADLVRVYLLQQLRDQLGVTTSSAVKALNASFDLLGAGVHDAWQCIDASGYQWGDVAGEVAGPWLVFHARDRKIISVMAADKTTLVEAVAANGIPITLVCDIRIAVQVVSIKLTNDAVEDDVKSLLAIQSAKVSR